MHIYIDFIQACSYNSITDIIVHITTFLLSALSIIIERENIAVLYYSYSKTNL